VGKHATAPLAFVSLADDWPQRMRYRCVEIVECSAGWSLVNVCGLDFVCNSAHTFGESSQRGGNSISAEFMVEVSTKPHKSWWNFRRRAICHSWKSGAKPWHESRTKQREALTAQLARERFLADSRVGQQYLTHPMICAIT